MSKRNRYPKISKQMAYTVIIMTIVLVLAEVTLIKQSRINGCRVGLKTFLEDVYGPLPITVDVKLGELCTNILKK